MLKGFRKTAYKAYKRRLFKISLHAMEYLSSFYVGREDNRYIYCHLNSKKLKNDNDKKSTFFENVVVA